MKFFYITIFASILGLSLTPSYSSNHSNELKPIIDSKAATQAWDGIGLSVYDGSTLEVSRDGKIFRILLAYVNAPVRGQPFFKEARNKLKEMSYGQQIRVKVIRQDRLGRLIAKVQKGEVDMSEEMVKAGLAWVYRHHKDIDQKLIDLEDKAHNSGLWQDDKPVAPWEYKQQQYKNMATRIENKADKDSSTNEKQQKK